MKIKIHVPATTTFMTKKKKKNSEVTSIITIDFQKKVFAGKLFLTIFNPVNKTDSI